MQICAAVPPNRKAQPLYLSKIVLLWLSNTVLSNSMRQHIVREICAAGFKIKLDGCCPYQFCILPFKCAVSLELFMVQAYEKDENKVGYISAADLLNTIESSGYKISSTTTIRSPN
jgi:hypothetical protein